MSNTKRIYLDYSATTPIDPRVLKVLIHHSKNIYGNASSISKEGVLAKKVLVEAREDVAKVLSGHSDEIIFTSGGTESNNLAILGAIEAVRKNGKAYKAMHVICSSIEHSSVKEVFDQLRKLGVVVDEVKVSDKGIVDVSELKNLIRSETVLVSIQYANSEIGVVQPIKEIAKVIRHHKKHRGVSSQYPLLHTDASAGSLYLDLNVLRLGVDLMTLDGHKIYGPKGVGALYKRRGVELSPITFGGSQEAGLRPGTENVPAIASFAYALTIAEKEKAKESARLFKLRDFIYSQILGEAGKEIVANGDMTERLTNNINISIKDCDTEFLTLQLDAKGFSVSTKSACLTGEDSSYVVGALGGEEWRAKNTLRISLGRFTTKGDCQKFVSVLKKLLQ